MITLEYKIEYSGDLTMEKQLFIDSLFDQVRAQQYAVGLNRMKLDLLYLLKTSQGECFEYFAQKIFEDKNLLNKYYPVLLEAGYQKQNNLVYSKLPKFQTSRIIKGEKKKEEKKQQNNDLQELLAQRIKEVDELRGIFKPIKKEKWWEKLLKFLKIKRSVGGVKTERKYYDRQQKTR